MLWTADRWCVRDVIINYRTLCNLNTFVTQPTIEAAFISAGGLIFRPADCACARLEWRPRHSLRSRQTIGSRAILAEIVIFPAHESGAVRWRVIFGELIPNSTPRHYSFICYYVVIMIAI